MSLTIHATTSRGPQVRPSPLTISPLLAEGARLCATGLVGALMFLLASAAPQPAGAAPTDKDASGPIGACEQPPHAAATPPARGPDSGTQPGGAGSTGWSGGTGGSFIGTTPHAATPGSPDRQPEVVTGLDPRPEAPDRPC